MFAFKIGVNPQEHDLFVQNHPLSNLLQSSNWALVKDNWEHTIVGVYDDDKLVASSMILIKHLPLGLSMIYAPRGPIMDYHNSRLVKFFIQELKKYAKKKHCLFIKIDPCIHINDYRIEDVNDDKYDVDDILENLKKAGAIHQGYAMNIADVIQPRFQANVYKDEHFEDNLPKHTKRLMKDAIKHHVKVVMAKEERLDEFSAVVALTEERKNVNLRNEAYFKQLMDIYQDNAYLFLGEVDIAATLSDLLKQKALNDEALANVEANSRKKLQRLKDIDASLSKSIAEFKSFKDKYPNKTVIAGVLSIKYGKTMEMLYAGMNEDFKKFMPQYYIYVENMKYAFEHGCEYCNMGGVEGDLKDGLTKFKSNFNPMIEEFIGEFDIPVNKVLYQASAYAYKVRKLKHAAQKD